MAAVLWLTKKNGHHQAHIWLRFRDLSESQRSTLHAGRRHRGLLTKSCHHHGFFVSQFSGYQDRKTGPQSCCGSASEAETGKCFVRFLNQNSPIRGCVTLRIRNAEEAMVAKRLDPSVSALFHAWWVRATTAWATNARSLE